MYNWARDMMGLSKIQKEETLQKIRDTYAEKKRRVYDPREDETFLNEIASDVYTKKYKTDVSLEEAQTITELSQEMKRTKEKMKDDFTWKTRQDGLEFGAAKVALDNYTGALKLEANKELITNPFKSRKMGEMASAMKTNARISFNFIADNSRAMVASIDNSFFGRQGIKALLRPTTSKIWVNSFGKSFSDISKTITGGVKEGDAILDGIKTEVYSRENYLNGRYELGKKLDIGTSEEEFPTSAPSRIPVLGRLFKASEVAYTAGAMRMRADMADKFYSMAENTGVDMENKEEVGEINTMVNSMTGRGSLGRLEGAAPMVNKVFFSAKFFKANLDTLTKPITAKTSFARKQAAINLLSMIANVGAILLIADTIDDDSVDFDPRSANFGKIKIGNVRLDITGGIGSIAILASRILTQSSKSSVTGTTSEFGDGYGSQTGMDAIWNFTENKFSPMFSVAKELVEQETFEGDKPTLLSEVKNLSVPIIVDTAIEAQRQEGLATALLATIADAIGISANVYSYSVNWENNLGKELAQFKERVGDKKFKEANKEYNEEVNAFINKMSKDEEYLSKDNEDKKSLLFKEKSNIKDKIFKKYKFKYIRRRPE